MQILKKYKKIQGPYPLTKKKKVKISYPKKI